MASVRWLHCKVAECLCEEFDEPPTTAHPDSKNCGCCGHHRSFHKRSVEVTESSLQRARTFPIAPSGRELARPTLTSRLKTSAFLLGIALSFVACWNFGWHSHAAQAATRECVQLKWQQFLFPQARRHHLQLVLGALESRGLTEHHAVKEAAAQSRESAWAAVHALEPSTWSTLWSFQPLLAPQLPQVLPHHRINHFPRSEVLTMKAQLVATARHVEAAAGIRVMKRHFVLPEGKEEFLRTWRAERGRNQTTQWLLKGKAHHGVSILTDPALLVGGAGPESGSVVAEYVDPLLIGGHKFDIGVYVAVSSLAPLTVYAFDRVLLRFCKAPHPPAIHDHTPADAYVIDDYMPPWEIAALRPYYLNGSGVPNSEHRGESPTKVLSAHLESLGVEPEAFWQRVEAMILAVVCAAHGAMHAAAAAASPHPRTFFELLRWDFMVDRTGTPVLNEVNLSPNLMPKLFPSGNDVLLKRAVAHDLLHLAGAGLPPGHSAAFQAYAAAGGRRDSGVCGAARCEGCPGSAARCAACVRCVEDGALRAALLEAVAEFHRRGDFRLIFPAPAPLAARLAPLWDRSGTPLEQRSAWLMAGAEHLAWEKLAVDSTLEEEESRLVPQACITREQCSLHGDCVNSACRCDLMYTGHYCEHTRPGLQYLARSADL